jgi:cell division protein FtsW (lipid II flippase)
MMMDAAVIAGDCTKSAAGRCVGWFLSLGILLMIIQTFLTFFGNFTLAPLTGITLPYISYGGTSLLFATLISAMSYAKEKLQ